MWRCLFLSDVVLAEHFLTVLLNKTRVHENSRKFDTSPSYMLNTELVFARLITSHAMPLLGLLSYLNVGENSLLCEIRSF